jgi:hypothetical protein
MYEFPNLGSHCAVVKSFGEGPQREGLRFTPPRNSILYDKKTLDLEGI